MQERLRRDLAAARQKAAADIAHYKLQNPALSLTDMERLVGSADQVRGL